MNDKQGVLTGEQKRTMYERTIERSRDLTEYHKGQMRKLKKMAKELTEHTAPYYIAKNTCTGQFLEPYLDLNREMKFKYVDYFVFLTADEVKNVKKSLLYNQVDILPESSFYCKAIQDEQSSCKAVQNEQCDHKSTKDEWHNFCEVE